MTTRGNNPTLMWTDAPVDPPDPKLDLYCRALMALRTRDPRWNPNYHRYMKWDGAHQLRWISYVEQSAVKDAPLPMARELYMMALTLRMTT